MALPINVNDLMSKNKVEGNRIEFKKGWNPSKIYHSICAFANDLDNLGGGYILVGVDEENGMAKRPVAGIPENSIDKILKEMVGFNNKIEPYYMPPHLGGGSRWEDYISYLGAERGKSSV